MMMTFEDQTLSFEDVRRLFTRAPVPELRNFGNDSEGLEHDYVFAAAIV